jgi:hypothetical protein
MVGTTWWLPVGGRKAKIVKNPGVGVDRTQVEARGMGDRNSSVRIRTGRRRIEGNEEQEQPAASSGTCPPSASSLARTYALSLGGGLDFCQSALRWQNSIHLPDPFSPSHPSRDRESLWNQEQQGSTDRVAHATPLTSDIADLQRGECEGHTIAAPPHNSKNHLGTLRSSRFYRPAASSQEGGTDDVSIRISGEIESKKHYRNRVRTAHSLVLGVRGCPKQTLPKSANCFEILVSAAGFEPATHALKGRCSTT